MKIALIAYDFYPSRDGIAHTLTNLCKVFQNRENFMYVFNQDCSRKRIFNVLEKKEYKLWDLSLFLRKRKMLFLSILSFWKIIKDKRITFSDKLNILVYVLFRPKVLIRTIKNIWNLYPYFKKIDFDIIFGGASDAYTIPLIFVLSRIFNKRIISFGHGNEFLVHTPLSLRSYYLKNLDKIILHTEKLKNLIIKIHHLDENMLHLLPPGLNLKDYEIGKSKEELRREFNIPEDTFVLLSVGRHVSRKNFNLVIRAVFEIKKIEPDIKIKYFLIGQGPKTAELKELARNLNLDKEIKFLGYCDDLKRNKFYKISDVFLMPSVEEKESIEGFGVVFLEANYYNVPVIGTYSGGLNESILNQKTGLLVEPNNLYDLVEKVLFLYHNEDIRKKMGEMGYNRVINDFNWEKLYFEYINVFRSVLNEREKVQKD